MESFTVPKKVNRHVLKALEFLQESRSQFVQIEAIKDRVRHSLRYTKPVLNLDFAIQESLRKQTELGIVRRSGASYAMALSFQGVQKKRRSGSGDPLTEDEIAKVRKMLRNVQKPSVKGKRNAAVAPRVIFKKKSHRSIPSVQQKFPDISAPSSISDQFVPEVNTTGRRLRSAIGVLESAPTSLKVEESIDVPKKVNRHVLKAVRHLTERQGYEFAPLEQIQNQAMWTMRNLNPVPHVESVIERSVKNLTNVGVLAEQHKSYRLHCREPLALSTSFSIFGKVSASFLPSPQDVRNAIQEQNIPYMEEPQVPMPHVSVSQSSSSLGGESYSQASGSLSSSTSQSTNTRQPEGIFGMEIGLSGSLSSLPLVSSESISLETPTSTPGEASPNSASFSSLSSPPEGVEMENSIIGLCGSLSHEELALRALCRERQNSIGANNIPVMDLDEVMPRDPVIQEVPTYLEAMNMDIVPGMAFIFGPNNISSTNQDQQMSNDSHVSVFGEMQYYFQTQQPPASAEAMDLDIRPVEEVLGTEANVENERELPQVASESPTNGDMHNAYAEDSHVSESLGAQANSVSRGASSYEMHNTEDMEMPSFGTNSNRAPVIVYGVSPRFHESLVQFIPNEAERSSSTETQNDEDEQ